MGESFVYVIYCEGGYGSVSQGFYFYVCFCGDVGCVVNDYFVLFIYLYVDFVVVQFQWMVEGDKFVGFFGGYDVGQDSGLEYRLFFCMQFLFFQVIYDFIVQYNYGMGVGGMVIDFFCVNVYYIGIVFGIKVCKCVYCGFGLMVKKEWEDFFGGKVIVFVG